MVIVAILVLVLFGAGKLPGFGRSLGRSVGEFWRAKEEFERELHRSIDERGHDHQNPATLKEAETIRRRLRPTFRPRFRLRGENLLVLLLMIVCGFLLVIATVRPPSW